MGNKYLLAVQACVAVVACVAAFFTVQATNQIDRSLSEFRQRDRDEAQERKIREAAHTKVLADQGVMIRRAEALNRLMGEIECKAGKLNGENDD